MIQEDNWMGKIRVHRRGYHRKDGTYVRPTDYLMEDRGKKGKTPPSKRWFSVSGEGELVYKGKGWHADTPERTRHYILNGLAKTRGWNALIKRLNAVRNVTTSRKFKRCATIDIKWMQRMRDK